jgi:hypothetical protein
MHTSALYKKKSIFGVNGLYSSFTFLSESQSKQIVRTMYFIKLTQIKSLASKILPNSRKTAIATVWFKASMTQDYRPTSITTMVLQ